MSTPIDVPPIQARQGRGSVENQFKGKPFMHCMQQLLKNCRDWHARAIWIVTKNRKQLIIIDDGDGMNEKNRTAFISVGETTAEETDQDGQFDTGVKQTIFSISSRVTVITVAKDRPDVVVRFSMTAKECEHYIIHGESLTPEAMLKDKTNWPYDFEHGSVIIFDLKKPSARNIRRGKSLARELSLRLPPKMHDVINIDGVQGLPPVQVIGDHFLFRRSHKLLGSVDIHLMRPKSKPAGVCVRLTAHEIGDSTISSLADACKDLEGFELDPVYTFPEVAGTVVCGYFDKYATEGRDKVDPAIADDELTKILIRLLNTLAPEIKRKLGFRAPSTSDSDDETEILELLEIINASRDIDIDNLPPTHTDGPIPPDDDTDDDDDETGTDGPKGQPLKLRGPSEVEIGETFEVTIRIRKDLQKSGEITLEKLVWQTGNSRCTGIVKTEHGIRMTAHELRIGYVRAEIQGKSYEDIAQYNIVQKRQFKVTPPTTELNAGESVTIQAMNTDKLSGELKWRLEGPGSLTVRNTRVRYKAAGAGSARIIAYDSNDPKLFSLCEVTIKQRLNKNIVCLFTQDEPKNPYVFEIDLQPFQSSDTHGERPVIMMRQPRVHKLYINTVAPSYKYAKKAGHVLKFLWREICSEFARFVFFNFSDELEDTDSMSPSQIANLMNTLEVKAFRTYLTLIEKLDD